jgi:CheY-like chemotaxis protein
MACVLALTGDLLFGSRVQGALALAGHEVELVADEPRLRERLAESDDPVRDPARAPVDVLVVDLTDERLDGAAIVRSLSDGGALRLMRTLGFYSHVNAAARERAERAGFDLVVARSRMAREGVELVERLLATPRPASG